MLLLIRKQEYQDDDLEKLNIEKKGKKNHEDQRIVPFRE